MPFLIKDFPKTATVVQPCKSVRSRKQLQFRLRPQAPPQLNAEQSGKRNERRAERRHQRPDRQGALPPRRVNILFRRRRHDYERRVWEVSEPIQPPNAIDRRCFAKASFRCRHKSSEGGGVLNASS